MRKEILETAIAMTCGDRDESYGPPVLNLSLAAKLKATFWGHLSQCLDLGHPIRQISPAEREAIDLVFTKLSRIGTGPVVHQDNYVDACAYMAIAGQMAVESQPQPEPQPESQPQPEPEGPTLDYSDGLTQVPLHCNVCKEYMHNLHLCEADGSKQEHDHTCHIPHMARPR